MKGKLLRLAVTVFLLALVLSRVDWDDFRRIGAGVRPGLVAIGYALNLVMVALNTVRWRVLVNALGVRVSMLRLGSYYFVCMFFNNFMPTSIGGDVIRVIDLARHTGRKTTAMASIVVERLLGLYVLFPLCLGAFFLLRSDLPERRWFLLAEGGMAAAFFFGTLVIRRRNVRRLEPLLRPFESGLRRFGLREKAAGFYDTLDFYKGRRREVGWALFLSVLSRAVWVVSCWVLGLSIGIDLGPVHFFLLMPLVEVGRMIPISLNGMGIREGVLVIVLGLFGTGEAEAVFLSVLVYGIFLINGLLGGVVYGLRGFFDPKPAPEGGRDGTA
ncbi:MAG: flippase-like domain-containing protein [Candidatus Eisenbacteria bacterium]|nr:flippase-like domain-containing protein [Candidatus Eisenbacteria bacterium]